ncbi:MAG: S8 family serine peptidase [Caldilineaceae bacterium]
MIRLRRTWLVALLLFAVLAWGSRTAQAHATLTRSDPADGSLLDSAPGEVNLWFDEPVVAQFSSVRLTNEENQFLGGATVDPNQRESTSLRILLPPLEKGSYLLFWKILSNEDGHYSQGLTAFSVGVAGNVSSANRPVALPISPSIVEALLRWLNLLLLTSAVGALSMLYLVLAPLKQQTTSRAVAQQQQLQRQILRWAVACALGLLLVNMGLLIWQLRLAQEQTASQSSWFEQTQQLLLGTFWGNLWIVRQCVLLFFASGLWFLSRRQQDTVALSWHLLIAGRSIDLLIIQALSSHQIGGTSNWLFMLFNVTAHLLAASIWMGSILVMALWIVPTILRKQKQSAIEGWQPIRWSRFTLLAASSVALLFASGLYSMGKQVASLDALLTTDYGWLLLGKLALVVLAGLCGIGNMLLVHPQAPQFLGRWLTQRIAWKFLARFPLPRLLLIEAIFGVLVLAASSLLSASAPPSDITYAIDPAQIQPTRGQRVGDMLVTLSASPNRLGQNVFDVRLLRPPSGDQPRILSVMLVFTYLGQPDKDETSNQSASVIAQNMEENRYQITGNYLKRPGDWQIDIRIAREGTDGAVVSFPWLVPPSGTIQQVWISKYPWQQLLSVAAAILALVLGTLIVLTRRRVVSAATLRQGRQVAAAILLLLLLLHSVLVPHATLLAQSDVTATAQIAQSVQSLLANADSQQRIPVIVVLRQQADLSSLNERSRASRLQQVVQRLQAQAEHTQSRLRSLLRMRQSEGQVTAFQPLWIINGVALTASASLIRELATLPEVAEIRLDGTVQAPPRPASTAATEPNITLINAPALWNLGIDGTGVVVASVDTGVDLTHPDLQSRWRGGSNSWFDPYHQHATPTDLAGNSSGHGTWTVGVMMGGDAGGSAIGVAPGAQWIAAKIFDDQGKGNFANIHAAYQWLLDPDGNPNSEDAPQVVNNSWDLLIVGCNLEFATDLQVLRAAGILPVFAAGNDGPSPNSSVSPGNNPGAFAVGAIKTNGQIYSLSSRGPTNCGGTSRVFPDLVAPGVDIRTSAPSGFYTLESGTSLAAPHVSGALALLLSAFPDLSPSRQEAALRNGAIDLGDIGPDNKFGQGQLNVFNSYQWLRDSSPNQPPEVDAGSNLSVTLPVSITLRGSVSDDGLPISNTLAITWSMVSGNGAVRFGAPHHEVTTATFDAAGTYQLRLTASDGELTSSDERTITLLPPNHPPSVEAGADLTFTLLIMGSALPFTTTLSGVITDDGLPTPASLVITWSVISGASAVQLSALHSITTTASFSVTGSYLLRLSASDGALTASDDQRIVLVPSYRIYFPLVQR